jgi:hypothetical protein
VLPPATGIVRILDIHDPACASVILLRGRNKYECLKRTTRIDFDVARREGITTQAGIRQFRRFFDLEIDDNETSFALPEDSFGEQGLWSTRGAAVTIYTNHSEG